MWTIFTCILRYRYSKIMIPFLITPLLFNLVPFNILITAYLMHHTVSSYYSQLSIWWGYFCQMSAWINDDIMMLEKLWLKLIYKMPISATHAKLIYFSICKDYAWCIMWFMKCENTKCQNGAVIPHSWHNGAVMSHSWHNGAVMPHSWHNGAVMSHI